ncbi:histone deacetylase [Saccharomycopsis crataegensis]|uniref:Histone deacetylase HDA1 n=1 Tax=Saccharomycopsis crataegensis TaxID=43959 RepID=A0AAV5QEZ2_9ASCO|nr:histone deacetylase [Saccharomycopsis crataegensis]
MSSSTEESKESVPKASPGDNGISSMTESETHLNNASEKRKFDEISDKDDKKPSDEKTIKLEKKEESINNGPVVKTYGISKVKYPQNSVIVSSRKPNLRYIPLKTGLCYDVRMRYHAKIYTSYYEYIDPHPEDPRRIYRIYKILAEEGLINDPTLSGSDDIGDLMVSIPVREASEEEILQVHTKEHLNFLKETTAMTKEQLLKITESGDSVYFNHDSFFCAKLSCGGVIEACKAVVEGRVKNSFAIVRPPGHHSEPEAPGGFCLFSNVAVAAKNILKNYSESVRKIVILDWDVHHGNGTQKCFYDDPRVLYISLHRFELGKYYPGTPAGDYDQAGEGAGEGFNINIPWPTGGMGDADYIYAFNNVIIPICLEFNPDLVLVSSGFDAADGDMIGQCHVSPGCYGHMVNLLKNLARGHLCVALEGGYNLDSISISALAVAKALLGEPPDELKTHIPSVAAVETIYKVREFQSRYWKSMRPGFASISDNNVVNLTKKTTEEGSSKTGKKQDLISQNTTCLSDAVRLHQATNLKERYGLMNLPMLLNDLSSNNETNIKFSNLYANSSSFDNQFLATPNIFQQETVCILVHDPFEIYGHIDPLYGSLESYSSVYMDPTEKLINWVISEKNFGLIDVSIPTAITNNKDKGIEADNPTNSQGNASGSTNGASTKKEKPMEEYNNILYSQELLLYLWDNYLKFFSNLKNLIFFGIGDSYNGIVYLLGHRQVVNTSFETEGSASPNGGGNSDNSTDSSGISSSVDNTLGLVRGKIERACSINFLNSHNQLRPIIPLVDESLTDWFYKNSLVFTSKKHPIWDNNDNYNKRPRRKFGRVLKSEMGDNLYDVFQENYEEAMEFALETLEEFESDESDTD